MNLLGIFGRIIGHFHALGDCAGHSLQYRTLLRLSFYSMLTTAGVDWIGDATFSSFTAVNCIALRLYYLRLHVLLDKPVLLIVLRRQFGWQLFHFRRWFLYTAAYCCVCAKAWSFFNNVAWCPSCCHRVVFCMLHYACILRLVDCGNPSTEIPLRTYSS